MTAPHNRQGRGAVGMDSELGRHFACTSQSEADRLVTQRWPMARDHVYTDCWCHFNPLRPTPANDGSIPWFFL